jgi:dTDP-4-amino-4,6-dideoxygalactose transaminase
MHARLLNNKIATVKMGDLAQQHREIKGELNSAIVKTMQRGDFVLGEAVKNFEATFANYTNAKHCIGVGNGTDALEIMLLALDLPLGSSVILPSNSFVATAEAIVNVGLRPKFVDVNSDFTMNREHFQAAVDPDVSAVIVVHLYGYPNEIDWIPSLFMGRNVPILEDCAQAHGARIGASHVGTIGKAGAFSFYPGKNLGAMGDAGAIITNDDEFAVTCRRIANHGRLGKFDHEIIGRNSRLDTLQAAVLSVKIRKLDSWNERRRENADSYRQFLSDESNVVLPPASSNFEVYHHFVIQTDLRDELREHLKSLGVETGIHYPQSIDELLPFQQFSNRIHRSRKLARSILSLPIAEHLTRDEIRFVSHNIMDFFEKRNLHLSS